MTTIKQYTANRENAKKSTGPITEEGCERAKMNALKHGLTAETILIGAERAEDYEAFRDALFEDRAPVGALECVLVERIVLSAWRMRRAARREAGMERQKHMRAKRMYDNEVAARKEGKAQIIWSSHGVADPREEEDSLSGDQLNRLSYESAAERSFFRAFHNLERVQARRLGQDVKAPIAIDLDRGKDPEIT